MNTDLYSNSFAFWYVWACIIALSVMVIGLLIILIKWTKMTPKPETFVFVNFLHDHVSGSVIAQVREKGKDEPFLMSKKKCQEEMLIAAREGRSTETLRWMLEYWPEYQGD